MESERKTVKFDTQHEIESGKMLRDELTLAMVENRKIKRLIDIFLFLLFLLFITYTTL